VILAVLGAALALSGCAQTSTLFDGTTGALTSSPQTVDGGTSRGHPPLPARRHTPSSSSTNETGLLSALGDLELSAPAVAPRSVVSNDTTVDLYIRLARQVRQCWLGPGDPALPGHGFRGKAKPGGAGEAEIDIYKDVPGRKYGPHVFEVKISASAGGSRVRSTNRRVDEELANALRADVARWARGGTGCVSSGGNSA